MAKKSGTPYQELVALVASTFHPNHKITEGTWVEGPDGNRDMDVLIEGEFNGAHTKVLVECKDHKRPVGIGFVEALDSKREDLDIDMSLISSNSGFTDPALSKAKRKNIGTICVVKRGDKRAKFEIYEKMYFQRLSINSKSMKCHYYKTPPINLANLKATYKGLLVYKWIAKAMLPLIGKAIFNVTKENPLKLTKEFSFAHPPQLKYGKQKFLVSRITGVIEIDRKIYSINTRLDASTAIYDYMSKQLILPSGKVTLSMGFSTNYERATLETEISDDIQFGVTFNQGKIKSVPANIHNWPYKSENEVPNLDPYLVKN